MGSFIIGFLIGAMLGPLLIGLALLVFALCGMFGLFRHDARTPDKPDTDLGLTSHLDFDKIRAREGS